VIQYFKNYLQKYPEQRKATVRAYNYRNKELILANYKIYYQKNKEKIRQRKQARYAEKKIQKVTRS
jgi:hypothetical protein